MGCAAGVGAASVLAFGHPFLQAGSVDFPMTAAEVLVVVPSAADSQKLTASGIEVLGSIRQDRQAGVLGKLGAGPPMVPVTVSVDGEGFVYVEDRLKDMYISGGENVYPAEIENILYELTEIREVAVIGVPDDRWGETGCAVVSLQDSSEMSAEEILAYCRPRLARFKHPNHVVFVDELPRNAAGKVLKFELRGSIKL